MSALIGIIFGIIPGTFARFGLHFNAKIGLIFDVAKGAAACGSAYILGAGGFGMAVAGALAVFANNFSPFSRQHDVGISTALGVALAINPLVAAVWTLMWATGYGVIRRERIIGNLAGTLGTMALIWTTPTPLLQLTTIPPATEPTQIVALTLIVCFQIFIRLIPQARRYFRSIKPDEAEE
ncbi:hypothetical protein MASR2M18_13560 [Ignavibacteria bacterium]